MTGPLGPYGVEREIEIAAWRILCREARAAGRTAPPRPRRVKPGPKDEPIPDGLLVGVKVR